LGGFGRTLRVQRLPFHRSCTGDMRPSRTNAPTATHRRTDGHEMPPRSLWLAWLGTGGCRSDQACPFHRSAESCPPEPSVPPTAIHQALERHDTSYSVVAAATCGCG